MLTMLSQVCPSVCLSHSGIMSKRMNISSKFFHCLVPTGLIFSVSTNQTAFRYSDKDCGLLHPTIYSFLLEVCMGVGNPMGIPFPWESHGYGNSHMAQTAYCWTSRLPCRRRSDMERPIGRRHLSTISAHIQKTIRTASVSTFILRPSLIN